MTLVVVMLFDGRVCLHLQVVSVRMVLDLRVHPEVLEPQIVRPPPMRLAAMSASLLVVFRPPIWAPPSDVSSSWSLVLFLHWGVLLVFGSMLRYRPSSPVDRI